MALTPEQLVALRSVPLGEMPNKVRLARTMLGITKAADFARALGMTSPEVSDLELGKYKDMPLEKSRRVAEFIGAPIEDIFPARAEVA